MSLHDVTLLPREVVVVLDVQDDARAELFRDVLVDEFVVRRRVAPHQVHRVPIFLTRFFIQRKPGEVLELLRQIRTAGHRDFAISITNLRPGSARTRMTEQREVFAGWQIEAIARHGERAEFDEMISAAAGPELGPRLVAKTAGDGRSRPVVVHHIVIAAVLEGAADPETRFALDDVRQPVALTGDDVRLAVINGELHPAGDIDTDGIGNHGIFRGKNATNWQSVSGM